MIGTRKPFKIGELVSVKPGPYQRAAYDGWKREGARLSLYGPALAIVVGYDPIDVMRNVHIRFLNRSPNHTFCSYPEDLNHLSDRS